MEFQSQAAAKEFLVQKILEQGRREGVALTDEDRRLLYFTEAEPETVAGISPDRLAGEDPEYEAKVVQLLRNVYQLELKAGQGQAFHDALRELSKGDHYLVVMAKEALGEQPTLPEQSTLRDNVLYLLIAIGLVVAVVGYVLITER